MHRLRAAAAAKSLQSCPTLCDPIDGSPPGSPVPGILQARTLEWAAIAFSNAWKWKVKVKSLSRVQLFATPWTVARQAPPSVGFSRQEYWSGCHCLLHALGLTKVICVRWWVFSGFPCGLTGKESTHGAGNRGSIPGRRERLPTPVFWPGEFHGLYSPWGHKESDTTERLSLPLSLFICICFSPRSMHCFLIRQKQSIV